MTEFQFWCRLCGALDGSALLPTESLLLIEQIFDISTNSISVCLDCNFFLLQINETIKKAKELQRLFTGLMQENEADLSRERLNAYRAHFNLEPMPEDVFLITIPDNNTEYDEMVTESLEYEAIEELETDQTIEQNEFLRGEVYVEDDGEKTEENVVYDFEQQKTEEESFFCFQCHLCKHPEFPNMKLLSKHCKAFHDSLPKVRCCSEECDSILSTWRRLLIHKEKHFPSNHRFHCPACQKSYNSLGAFQIHVETHKTEYICSHCGKTFKEVKTLRLHEQTHTLPLDERRKHICHFDDCGAKFITKQACQNHIAMKHQKSVVCYCKEINCGKGFFTKKSFYEHMRNSHGERKYFCDECDFKARTRQAINAHKDVHTIGLLYSCDFCSAAFSVYKRLKHHMICHSSDTPFECPHCRAGFKRSKDLKRHINIHTNDRPFNCQFCSKSFSNAANRRKHSLKEHSEKLKSWEAENGVGGRKNLKCYQ